MWRVGTNISGFTLLELIIIMMIVGILAATAVSRYGGEDSFRIRVEQENLISALNQAQQLAMQGPNVSFILFNTSPPAYSIELGGTPYTLAGVSYPQNIAGGINLTPVALTLAYDALGGTTATNINLNTHDGDSLRVCVAASGYAYAC